MSPGHDKVIRVGEGDQRSVLLFARPELFRELLSREEVAIFWTGRIVKFREQIGEYLAIAQRQSERQVKAPIGVDRPDWRQPSSRTGNMSRKNLQFRRGTWHRRKQPRRKDKSRNGVGWKSPKARRRS